VDGRLLPARHDQWHELARTRRHPEAARFDAVQGDHRSGEPHHRGHMQDERRPARVGVLERDDPEPREKPEVVDRLRLVALVAGLAGLAVSVYLTVLHYQGVVPGCPTTGPI